MQVPWQAILVKLSHGKQASDLTRSAQGTQLSRAPTSLNKITPKFLPEPVVGRPSELDG